MKNIILAALALLVLAACAYNLAPEQQARLEKLEKELIYNQNEVLKLRLELDQAMLKAGEADNQELERLSQKQDLDKKAVDAKLNALESELNALKAGSTMAGSNDLQELQRQIDRQNAEITALKQAMQAQPQVQKVPESQPAAPPPPPPSALQTADVAAYEQARAEYEKRDFPKAIQLFDAFIKNYPKSDYLGNANYWKGESRYAMSDWNGALKEFQGVVSQYPNSWKEADAQLKIGMCFMRMGEDAKARAALNLIKRNYPQYERMDLVNKYLDQLD